MTDRDANDLVRQREEKLEALRRRGLDPFGGRYPVTHWAGELTARLDKAGDAELQAFGPVSLAGRLVAMRDHGKTAFAHLMDRTGRIQLYARADELGDDFAPFRDLDVGDFIGVTGGMFRTRTGQLTLAVKSFAFLAKSLRPLPEKWHGLKDVETRYRQRYVDLIVNPDVREIFLLRARLIQRLRAFLDARGFLEVETPMMQPIPGGAIARPFQTHHNALDMDLYLRIAPELYLKRLVVGGFERVYEINRNFRNEGVSTQHNPEFTTLEFYQAYADYQDLMELTEEMFTELAQSLLGRLSLTWGEHAVDLARPWRRLSFFAGVSEALGTTVSVDTDAAVVARGGRQGRHRQAGRRGVGDMEGGLRRARRADARAADVRDRLSDRAVAAGEEEARQSAARRSVRAVHRPPRAGQCLQRAERPDRPARAVS